MSMSPAVVLGRAGAVIVVPGPRRASAVALLAPGLLLRPSLAAPWVVVSSLAAVAAQVQAGGTVTFRPSGGSMTPLIRSRDQVVVAPVVPAAVEVGDIVLVRVAGSVYLHLVSAVDHPRARVQISNNRGRVNGWASHDRLYGLCVEVAGTPRPRTAGKLR